MSPCVKGVNRRVVERNLIFLYMLTFHLPRLLNMYTMKIEKNVFLNKKEGKNYGFKGR